MVVPITVFVYVLERMLKLSAIPRPGEVAAYAIEENIKKANPKAAADESTPTRLISFIIITT